MARWTPLLVPLLVPLLKSGKIRHVGVSNHNMEEIALADQILGEAGFRVEAVQNHDSLLYRQLPEGSGRAAAYNGILPQLQALTERMAALGEDRGASAADVATAWAIAKGTTPIIGVTKAGYIDGLSSACGIELADEEIAELEALADATDVDTRGDWEREM